MPKRHDSKEGPDRNPLCTDGGWVARLAEGALTDSIVSL